MWSESDDDNGQQIISMYMVLLAQQIEHIDYLHR